MMQKSIASDEAEMRYAPQTMLSIYSKYILHSLILTIPCSVCNTQNTGYRSRVHSTIMVAQCTRLLSCTLRHFQSIRARQELFTVNIQSLHAHTEEPCTLHHLQSIHRSRVHCTTFKVYVQTQEPLQRPADIVTQTSVGERSWPALEAVSRY